MSDEKDILTSDTIFCPECNAILNADGTCPNGCTLITYLEVE